MNEILSPGSVVTIRKKEAIIVGYGWEDRDGKARFLYRVVPYPFGYTQTEGIMQIPEEEVELVSQGYEGSAFSAYAGFIAKIRELGDQYTSAELLGFLRDAAEKRERDN